MRKNAEVLLLLPCTNKKPYTEAPTWKYVMKNIGPWLNAVDLAAVDCITDPLTGLPFGIVTESEQYLTIDKDEKPSPEKIPVLVEQIRNKLKLLSPHYNHIISYINVKSYWKAVEAVQPEFDIKMLPKMYMNEKNWNSKICRMGPIGMFKIAIDELRKEIMRATNPTRKEKRPLRKRWKKKG